MAQYTLESRMRFEEERVKLCKLYCERDLDFKPIVDACGAYDEKFKIRVEYQQIFNEKVSNLYELLDRQNGNRYEIYICDIEGIEEAEKLMQFLPAYSKKYQRIIKRMSG